ncbi:thioesterase II family protein [Streptomyces bikiniensis]|uniref:Thioesterase II family protein n=1 Tax=Streptomyces bikiniensis TaxID=1896 RepID=A0ABW8D1B8_STRBI
MQNHRTLLKVNSRMPHSLICIPFAGGGASFYRTWKPLPDRTPHILPVQLPGREEMFIEEPFRDVSDAAEALAPQIADQVSSGPVALFGHSLGAVIAFELARRLERNSEVRLTHLFVSGSPGPWSRRTQRATGLPEDRFLAQIQEFAGYRHDALSDPDLREILLPVLRADVEMHENYKPDSDTPLRTPIISLRGTDDHLVSRIQAEEWSQATTSDFRLVEVTGGHMYLAESPLQLMDAIAAALQP